MNKSWFFLGLFLAVFFSFSIVSAASPSDYGLKEGELISAIFSDDPDVYIINEHGYKRVFLNPEIFNFYKHLGGFFNIKLVTQEVRDSFPTSGLFRNCEDNDEKVYGVDIEGEDSGQLQWVNTSGEQATKDDPDFFKKVFCINRKEFNWYPKSQTALTTVKEVPKYERIKESESISTEKKIEAKTEFKDIGQVVICHHPFDSVGAFQTITISASALKAHLDHGDMIGSCFAPTPVVPAIPASSSLPFSPITSTSIPLAPIPTPILTPIPTPIYSSGTCLGFKLMLNKTTFLTLETLSFTISCTSGYEPFSRVEIRKSDGTFTGSSDQAVSQTPLTVNIGLGDRAVGSYTLQACFDTGCQKIAASVPFTIVSSSPTSTPTPTSGTTTPITSSSTPSPTASTSATPTPIPTLTPSPTPSTSGACTGFSLSLNKSTFAFGFPGETVSYTFSCASGQASLVRIEVRKPDGTRGTYTNETANTTPKTFGFTTGDLAIGSYTLQACFETTCNSVVSSVPFYINSTSTPTPTPSTARVSFDNFSRNLFLGLRGDDVKQLQALLVNEVNYSANLLTGYFGSMTQEAVKKLQEKYGVRPVSGYFGEITRQALRALLSR